MRPDELDILWIGGRKTLIFQAMARHSLLDDANQYRSL
jgi:hypothetical protein